MKKMKLSIIVAVAIIGTSLTAFTGKLTITPGWYGQTTDVVPPYSTSNPIANVDLDTKCPLGTQHICAVKLDANGNLVATRMSSHNFKP